MSEILPLFDPQDEASQKVRPSKRIRRTTPSDRKKSTSDPAIVLKPVTAELKELTLRQRVLPRYIFDQLVSEPVLDAHTAEARGAILGQVAIHNVHCERTKSDHLHLIWVHEGQLRYGLVWRDRPVERYTELEQHIQIRTQVLAVVRSLGGWRPPEMPDPNSLEPPLCSLEVYGEQFSYRPHDTLVELWAGILHQPLPMFVARHRRPLQSLGQDAEQAPMYPRPTEVVRHELQEVLRKMHGELTSQEKVEEELRVLCQEHRSLRERWQQYYDEWQSLPQIFIGR
jgi:hypothetical protein